MLSQLSEARIGKRSLSRRRSALPRRTAAALIVLDFAEAQAAVSLNHVRTTQMAATRIGK